MGYTIAVPIKSKKLQVEMLKFLEDNYRPWSKISEGTRHELPESYDCSKYIYTEEDLVYDDGKCRLGFNYSSGLESREYIFYVLYWIALRCGRKRNGKNYIVYDGHESIYLSFDKEENCTVIDEYGFHPQRRCWDHWKGGLKKAPMSGVSWIVGEKKRLDETDILMHNELKRLTQCWNEYKQLEV